MNSICLIGYRGTGKSTVAQQLAQRLGWDWVDSDIEVERRTGKSIAELFADDGEAAFRDLEADVVAEVCRRDRTAIALGGGSVLRWESREAFRQCGAVVWLRASVEAIVARLRADETTAVRRPQLTRSGGRREIEELLAVRTPIYRGCATLEVDTDGKAPAEIADEIVAALGLAP
jgi:shikimate kinase